VTALAVLDAVPIGEALARCDAHFAASWWHWFFYGQTAKRAERVISADPDAWYGGDPGTMGAEAYADYRRAGRTVACPTLVLWASDDDLEDLYGDVLAVWPPDRLRPPHGRGGPRRPGR
jgi:haloacetate dehalogenase